MTDDVDEAIKFIFVFMFPYMAIKFTMYHWFTAVYRVENIESSKSDLILLACTLHSAGCKAGNFKQFKTTKPGVKNLVSLIVNNFGLNRTG